MPQEPAHITGQVEGVPFELKPEFLAGDYWWRVWVGGHPKVLVRSVEHAGRVAELLADDQARMQRDRRPPPTTTIHRRRGGR
jgi:hypothetical protein